MQPETKRGFLAGLGAGVVAFAISYLIRVSVGGAFLPELAAQTLFTLTPGSVESVAVETFQSLAKYSAFTAAAIINILLYGVLGSLLFKSKDLSGSKSRLERFASFSIFPYLIFGTIGAVLLFITAIQSSHVTLPQLLLSMIPPQLAYGATLTWIKGPMVETSKPTELCIPTKPPKGKKFDRRRRLFIQAGVASAVGAALLVYGVGFLFKPKNTSTVQASPSSLSPQMVTANSSFYRVDVNIFPPSVNGSTWKLDVFGMVANPQTFTLAQIQAMNSFEQYNTLECVSNTIGGDLISTAKWHGVRLKDVLGMAGLQPSADHVVFTAVDGYDVAIPLDRAMLDGTLLAYEMNGAPLPQDHGYPIRAIVPGLYGMMNAKWIVNIEAVSGDYQGYWQVRGWTDQAEYMTGSEIVIPGDAQVTGRFGINGSSGVALGMVPIAGIAFAGDRGISKVEVSTDGGNTWTLASLSDPLSNYTWVFWSVDWNPPTTGDYKLMVRGTDGTGAVQTAVMAQPFPDGATGYHVVDISVLPAPVSSST